MVLGVCCVSVLLVGIDMTAVNVALPSVGHDFHTSASSLTWIIDAYTLALATLLMLSSSMADRAGRKLVFRIGLSTFVLGSALCAVAPDLGFLVGARVIQGVGGSMLNPVAMAIIANVFSDRAERARAIGVWAGVTGLSLAIGPIVGGALVGSSLGWRWIFVINVPIGLAAIVVATKVIPESKAARPRKVDVGGQALIALMLAALVFGVIEGPKLGWGSPAIITTLAVALLALIGFIAYESRATEPLLDLRFFRSIPFSAANLIAVFSFASLGSFLYVNSIYLQDARGYGPLKTGLLMVPLAIVSVLWGPRNGKILGRFGARIPFVIAGVAVTAASVILAQVTLTIPIVWLLIAYALIGLGNSSSSGPITQLAVAGMPPEQAGVAAGVSATTRQIGQTIGVAIAGVTLASVTAGSRAQLATATHTGWILMGAYGLAVLALGLVGTTGHAKRTAERALPTATSSPTPGSPSQE
ncbi:DHA2 family efflux MFS transporter permease subunit [Actinoallomurus soli]|uniref:DHA2 family efflux MFS transporter permease subunit n=1 Tax=Actinoallomurus soli TaxID=2952535 RepID=UPI003872D138